MQFPDQAEFFFNLITQILVNPPWPAPPDTGFGQFTQVGGGRHAVRHHFAWIMIMQLFQPELAAFCDHHGFFQALCREQLCQAFTCPQVAFPGGQGAIAQAGNGAAVANRGQHVMQHTAGAGMHSYIATGRHRQAGCLCNSKQPCQAFRIIRPQVQAGAHPAALREIRRQPVRGQYILFLPIPISGHISGQPQRQAMVEAVLKTGIRQGIFALGCITAAPGDQGAELGITGMIFRQEHQSRTLLQPETAAGDQLDRLPPLCAALRFLQRPHHAGQ